MLSLAGSEKLSEERADEGADLAAGKADGADTAASVLRMKLIGGNPAIAPAGQNGLPGTANYFKGNDAAHHLTGVPTFVRVAHREVYPSVDLAYYGKQGLLEYDFIVAPGDDPRRIAMGFDGARSMRLDGGERVLDPGAGEVRQHAPVLYQEIDGQKRHVPGRFVLSGERQVGSDIDNYDPSRPLIIDPVLAYSTYLGAPLPTGARVSPWMGRATSWA